MEIMPEADRRTASRHEERYERIPLHEVELIKYRDNRTPLVVKMLSGDALEGAIRWYDDRAFRLVQSDRSEITVNRQAVAYYYAKV